MRFEYDKSVVIALVIALAVLVGIWALAFRGTGKDRAEPPNAPPASFLDHTVD